MLLIDEPADVLWDRSLEMNNPNNGPGNMGQGSNIPPGGTYGSEHWANLSPFSQSPYGNSPLNDYGFPSYTQHGLPSESLARMPPPAPQPQFHHQLIQPAPTHHIPQAHQATVHMGHHQLPMLNTNTNQPQWPSQLTNPSPSGGSYSAPVPSITPVSSAAPVEAPRLPTQNEKPRRSLTVDEKRRMCEFAEKNVGMKQADIGAHFGVERSTVSKVLRNKEEYLNRSTEVEKATVKRSKTNSGSLERTLEAWARNRQRTGLEVTDAELKEQAERFAMTKPDKETLLTAIRTPNWLRKFRREYKLSKDSRQPQRLTRRASETNIDRAKVAMSKSIKRERGSGMTSPASATGQMSPLSEAKSDEDMLTDPVDDFSYKHGPSRSSTSLTSELRDNQTSNMSPVMPFTFSPDPNNGGFQLDHSMQIHQSGADFHPREKRSNTFPSLGLDFLGQGLKLDELAPQLSSAATTAPSSAVEQLTHQKELQALLPASIGSSAADANASSSPTLRRQGSNSSLTRQTNTPTSALASMDSSPVSPSQEEARRAAKILLSYMGDDKIGSFDQQEYAMVAQVRKKLNLPLHPIGRASRSGLSRIPEGDSEGPTSTDVTMETK